MSLTPSISDRERDPMGWLFGEIYGRFGNAFIDKFRSGEIVDDCDLGIENMKAVWSQQIRAHGMHLREIKRGLQACDRLRFPPSWPEFFALCRPVPIVDDAIREAVAQIPLRASGKDEWTHPAIYWAARKVGFQDVTTLPADLLRRRMDVAMASVLAEEVLPVPPATVRPALPSPEVTEEEVQKARATIAVRLQSAGKKTSAVGDKLDWARRIMDDVANGVPLKSPHLREAAEAALGRKRVRVPAVHQQ